MNILSLNYKKDLEKKAVRKLTIEDIFASVVYFLSLYLSD